MHNLSVFLIESRLGLRFAPLGSKLPNIGVENGGPVITEKLHSLLPTHTSIHSFSFPDPNNLPKRTYLNQTLAHYTQAATTLNQRWLKGSPLLTFGGDHSMSIVSLSAVLQRFGRKNTAVVMFDSHGDLNTPDTSPSGNLHGMWLSGFVMPFGNKNKIYPKEKLSTKQLRFVGNLLLDPAEKTFLKRQKIKIYDKKNISQQTARQLFSWAKHYKHLHISFDIDVFVKTLVPATGTPNTNGLTEKQVMTMLAPLFQHPSISLDIVEYNPQKRGARKTLKMIKKVLKTYFSAR